jgi:hypothetical protein
MLILKRSTRTYACIHTSTYLRGQNKSLNLLKHILNITREYIYIYIYICTCIHYMYTHTRTYVQLYTHTHYVYMNTHTHTHTCGGSTKLLTCLSIFRRKKILLHWFATWRAPQDRDLSFSLSSSRSSWARHLRMTLYVCMHVCVCVCMCIVYVCVLCLFHCRHRAVLVRGIYAWPYMYECVYVCATHKKAPTQIFKKLPARSFKMA